MVGAGTADGVPRWPAAAARSTSPAGGSRCSSRRTCTRRWWSSRRRPAPRRRRLGRRAATADLHRGRRGRGDDRDLDRGSIDDGRHDARLPGPDVVRAVALIGVVVMNYHGYLLLQRTTRGDRVVHRVFDPWNGPLSTRFAATFVLVAGMGVTLLTAQRDRRPRRAAQRAAGSWCAAGSSSTRRLLFDWIWPGTILSFYGAMFVVAAAAVQPAHPLGRRRRRRRRARRRGRRVVDVRARLARPLDARGSHARAAHSHVACCSTRSSTAPTRCCRGSPSSAPGSSSAGCLGGIVVAHGWPSGRRWRCSCWRR